MINQFKNKLKNNTAGNVSMLAGFLILPALVLIGSGLDIIRATTQSTKLQSALESATLASASLTNTRDVKTVVQDYIDVNLASDMEFLSSLNINVKEATTLNTRTVTISADAEIDTYFLKLVGVDTLSVSAQSTAEQAATSIEISLVIDISSSMSGSKLTNLVSSGKVFVEEVLDGQNSERTSLSIVPFGGSVNLGQTLFDDHVVPSSGSTEDPSRAQYDSQASIKGGKFRFSAGDNCIELLSEDFSDDLVPLASRSQIPDFWKWTNNHPWCPTDKNAVIANSNDINELTALFDNIGLSDGTGMDHGAAWGLKMLSPAYKGRLGGDFPDRPVSYDEDGALKVMVVMTDGNITSQLRPLDFSIGNVHNNRPAHLNRAPNVSPIGAGHFRTYGGTRADNNNQQTLYQGGSFTSNQTEHASRYFMNVCDEARENGIVVYTIGYRITAGSNADQLLNYCASDPSKYYFVESVDISSAFEAIAASVNALRLSG